MTTTITVDWIQLITALTAIYAAGLSTYIFIVNAREKRRVLNVEISHALAPYPGGEIEDLIVVKVTNPGYLNVTINNIVFLLPDNRQMVTIRHRSDKELPHELSPGSSVTVFTNIHEMANSLIEQGYSGNIDIKAICSDALGEKYQSNTIIINTSEP